MTELWDPPEGEIRADVAPRIVGNAGVKELLLASLCVFDANNVKNTVVPFVIVGKSGGGKSTLLECIKDTLPNIADIYNIDALTPVQVKGTVRGGKHIKADLSYISLFDEINKWQQNYLEGVLMPIFGGEKGARWREGTKMEHKVFKTLPIGTLLPHWEDFEGSGGHAAKRIHNIEQIMRRSIVVRLDEGHSADDRFLKDYANMLAGDYYKNITYEASEDLEGNQERIVKVINMAHDMGPQEIQPHVWGSVQRNVTKLARRIKISDRVSYHGTLLALVLRIANGLARRYGRDITYYEDFEFVMSVIESHAKMNDMLYDLCDCGHVCDLGRKKCPSCGEPLNSKRKATKKAEDESQAGAEQNKETSSEEPAAPSEGPPAPQSSETQDRSSQIK